MVLVVWSVAHWSVVLSVKYSFWSGPVKWSVSWLKGSWGAFEKPCALYYFSLLIWETVIEHAGTQPPCFPGFLSGFNPFKWWNYFKSPPHTLQLHLPLPPVPSLDASGFSWYNTNCIGYFKHSNIGLGRRSELLTLSSSYVMYKMLDKRYKLSRIHSH